jgi:pimeloyl-ACP methyl ester carboxylesterase/acyl carrier protein
VPFNRTAHQALETVLEGTGDLRGVVHAAGVLDDATVESLTPEQLGPVLAVKAGAAQLLDELTAKLDLSAFVLFSSAAGALGSPGQGNYAAANACLDALAARRQARGLSAVSLAWGMWEQRSGMTSGLAEPDLGRMTRAGLSPMSTDEALRLLDTAVASGQPLLLPVRLDLAALRAQATEVPALLRGLVRVRAARLQQPQPDALRHRLAATAEHEHPALLLAMVRGQIALVLGHPDPAAVGEHRALTEMGFDSLSSVELRNRLNTETGLHLPATLIFDYPTAADLADFLLAELSQGAARPGDGETAGQSAAADDTPGGLLSFYLQAQRQRQYLDGMNLLAAASQLRESFDTAASFGASLSPVPLARGAASPKLLCVSGPMAMSSAHQYSRFAMSFRDRRDVSALVAPGFTGTEPLPSNYQAVVGLLAESVREAAGGEPVVLVGHSSGGTLAHSIATALEEAGDSVAGVVLIDTYLSDHPALRTHMDHFNGMFLDGEELVGAADDTRLSAMGRYFDLIKDWRPEPLAAPLLFVRAALAPDGSPRAADDDAAASWDTAEAVVEVTGDHWTMMGRHAESTARAVDEWLGTRLGASVAVPGETGLSPEPTIK